MPPVARPKRAAAAVRLDPTHRWRVRERLERCRCPPRPYASLDFASGTSAFCRSAPCAEPRPPWKAGSEHKLRSVTSWTGHRGHRDTPPPPHDASRRSSGPRPRQISPAHLGGGTQHLSFKSRVASNQHSVRHRSHACAPLLLARPGRPLRGATTPDTQATSSCTPALSMAVKPHRAWKRVSTAAKMCCRLLCRSSPSKAPEQGRERVPVDAGGRSRTRDAPMRVARDDDNADPNERLALATILCA